MTRTSSDSSDSGAERAGYLSDAYAASLHGAGDVHRLPASGGCLVLRPVPGHAALQDAQGSYPLLCCADWTALEADLLALDGVVSVVAVLDPMVEHEPAALAACFPDLLRPYKPHYVVDLAVAPRERTAPHHRRNAARGSRELAVDVCSPARDWAADWARLYARLEDRHAITGPAAFAPDALALQLEVPGALVLRASLDDQVVGMCVFYVHGAVAYYHLAAYDAAGYERRASFALFDRALDLLADAGVRSVDLGGSAGAGEDDGLARFKRGWSTGTRVARLGGRVLDPARYAELCAGQDLQDPSAYFPAYRSPAA